MPPTFHSLMPVCMSGRHLCASPPAPQPNPLCRLWGRTPANDRPANDTLVDATAARTPPIRFILRPAVIDQPTRTVNVYFYSDLFYNDIFYSNLQRVRSTPLL
uniref:Uncharacterized protein n=1 Tax=Plectus sambesii TaxID=2011161 RepID=A0A914X9B1_9BILA